jgi:heat-inducible transcriptional repressor
MSFTARWDNGAPLDDRSREIFRRIVESYLESGEPVGSRSLSRLLPMSLSPASIRNVMSDLEELGLIYAPHVSAGRLPTQSGLRFFVDAFMQVGDLSQEERTSIERQIRPKDRDRPLETLMNDATRMLSGVSRGAGIVITWSSSVWNRQRRSPCWLASTIRLKTGLSTFQRGSRHRS